MKSSLALVFTLFLFLTGCVSGPNPSGGTIFTSVQGPIMAVSQKKAGSKKGMACASNILNLISTGDASIQTAAKSGKIKVISSVDYSNFSILGVYTKVCSIVHGS